LGECKKGLRKKHIIVQQNLYSFINEEKEILVYRKCNMTIAGMGLANNKDSNAEAGVFKSDH